MVEVEELGDFAEPRADLLVHRLGRQVDEVAGEPGNQGLEVEGPAQRVLCILAEESARHDLAHEAQPLLEPGRPLARAAKGREPEHADVLATDSEGQCQCRAEAVTPHALCLVYGLRGQVVDTSEYDGFSPSEAGRQPGQLSFDGGDERRRRATRPVPLMGHGEERRQGLASRNLCVIQAEKVSQPADRALDVGVDGVCGQRDEPGAQPGQGFLEGERVGSSARGALETSCGLDSSPSLRRRPRGSHRMWRRQHAGRWRCRHRGPVVPPGQPSN